MAFILSAVTEVVFAERATSQKTRGIISVQINAVPQIQRLPKLGSADPFSEVKQLQNQISLTRYGGGPRYSTVATEECTDANTIYFSFKPKGCGTISFSTLDSNGNVRTTSQLTGNFFVNSYAFNKTVNQFGQETWNMIDKPIIYYSSGAQFGSQNKVLARGISDGQTTPGINTGVSLSATGKASGMTTAIAAGNPGVGRVLDVELGVVVQVGNSTTAKGSEEGSGQANIPYQTIDVGEGVSI